MHLTKDNISLLHMRTFKLKSLNEGGGAEVTITTNWVTKHFSLGGKATIKDNMVFLWGYRIPTGGYKQPKVKGHLPSGMEREIVMTIQRRY